MKTHLAQVSNKLDGDIRGLGLFGLQGEDARAAPSLLNRFISNMIGLLTLIAGIWFFFVLISGAIAWIGAGGDRAKIEEARKRITMGLVGITIVVSAIFIAEIVGNLIGFPSITDPGSMIPGLGPKP